jgi:hypothetical protein
MVPGRIYGGAAPIILSRIYNLASWFHNHKCWISFCSRRISRRKKRAAVPMNEEERSKLLRML